jgi:hypothetical protein
MGPFTLLDFVGNDTTFKIAEIMFDEYRETRYAPPALLKRMVLAGMYGRKSGKGFYDYSSNPPAVVDLGSGLRSFASLRMTTLLLATACQATTTRPTFGPLTGAPSVVVQMSIDKATTTLNDMLKADSIPVARVETRDGFLESPWFDSATGRPTGRRPLGTDVVRVRAWVDPEKPLFSRITIESLYRQKADPSLPERELDRQLPPDHPVAMRIRAVIDTLHQRYGEPDRSE